MKKIIFVCSVLSALLFVSGFSQNVFCQDNSQKLKDVLSKMEEADKNVKTFETDFSQEIFYSATSETQNIIGNLKYKKPDSIYIEQKTPQEQKIYIDGKKITVYTPENAQAIVDDWKNLLNGDFAPASIISFGGNWKDLSKNNVINYVGEDGESYIVEIYPSAKKDWTMQMSVSKISHYPYKAIITSAGLIIKVNLSNVKTNQNLKKDVFKFTPPDGVEVIKL
ncbi:MAG: outer membrane lipoprotein carrier protein LolA [Endomicrobium sp.]|nr:outer membrane lipoprotein carrier protein LolA [Endomicrobium sp.]